MVVHTCILLIPGLILKLEDCGFKARLGYIIRLYLKNLLGLGLTSNDKNVETLFLDFCFVTFAI